MSLTIPRYPVPIWKLFLKMGGWLVGFSGVFLLIFTLISHLSLETAKRFEREGRLATAQVIEKYTTESRDSDGDTTTTYWLTLDYVTQRREEISLTTSVGTSAYRRAEVGQPFELLYLESEPRKVEVNPGSNRTASRVFQGVALVLGLLWLGAFWKVGSWSVAAVRARRFGTREQAKVVDVMRTAIRINNRPRYRLVWRDRQGREGRSLLRRGNVLSEYRAGDQIDIYHGVKTSWWVGDVGERPEFAEQS